MKNNWSAFVVLFFLGTFWTETYSQENLAADPKPFRNEFGLVIDNLFAKSSYEPNMVYNANNTISSTHQIHNIRFESNLRKLGLIYKRNFKNCAMRSKVLFGLGHNHQNTDKYSSENKIYSSQLYIGFEFQKRISKIRLNYGVDLFLHYKKATTNVVTVNPADFFDELNTSSSTWGRGIRPFFGISYYIIPKVSISTEFNFNYETYKVKNNSGLPSLYSEGKYLFFPLGSIGINLYFN